MFLSSYEILKNIDNAVRFLSLARFASVAFPLYCWRRVISVCLVRFSRSFFLLLFTCLLAHLIYSFLLSSPRSSYYYPYLGKPLVQQSTGFIISSCFVLLLPSANRLQSHKNGFKLFFIIMSELLMHS